MITHIAGDRYVNVNIQGKPYVYTNGASGLAGTVMYDVNEQRYKINNGSSWVDCNAIVNLTLSMEAHRALDWVSQKMRDEQLAKELAKKYVTVQDALDNLALAQERLDITIALAKDEKENV